MDKDKPLIYIVTVVFNGEKYIEQCIKSVIAQKYNNIRYIIIDGNSKDLTCGIISKYKDKLFYYISENDNGIYDAMNKAIRIIKEKDAYILFLNSDDYLCNDNVIYEISSQLEDCDFVYGNILKLNNGALLKYGNKVEFSSMYKQICQHQATFTKKSAFDKVGLYNIKYVIAADYDFSIKAFKNKAKTKYVDIDVSIMRSGGNSYKYAIKGYLERINIINENYNKKIFIKSLFYYIPRLAYYYLKPSK